MSERRGKERSPQLCADCGLPPDHPEHHVCEEGAKYSISTQYRDGGWYLNDSERTWGDEAEGLTAEQAVAWMKNHQARVTDLLWRHNS